MKRMIRSVAGALAAVVLGSGCDTAPDKPGAVPAPGTASVDRPSAPGAASRAQILGRLAFFEAPAFSTEGRGAGDNGNFLFVTAVEQYGMGNYQDAASTLELLLERGPVSAEAFFYKGVAEIHSGHLREGIDSLERSIAEKSPILEGDARFFLSKALLFSGDVSGARAELLRVAALKGDRLTEANEMLAAIDTLPPA